jgi:hypothetical protein
MATESFDSSKVGNEGGEDRNFRSINVLALLQPTPENIGTGNSSTTFPQ